MPIMMVSRPPTFFLFVFRICDCEAAEAAEQPQHRPVIPHVSQVSQDSQPYVAECRSLMEITGALSGVIFVQNYSFFSIFWEITRL